MKRYYLYPFALGYKMVTSLRNTMFNIGILRSRKLNTPTIGVGNLSVGGTGKSPVVMYLAELMTKSKQRTGVLSRGYGRNTKGYQLVNYQSNYKSVGDEAMQLFQRFKNKIVIAVCENRVLGAKKLIKDMDLQVLLLDDCFQHRYLQAGLSILLTDYADPYFKDHVLPAGDLRESRKGASRANIILVTKCPPNLNQQSKQNYISKIKPKVFQKVFFANIHYENKVMSLLDTLPIQNLEYYHILLVTGIANPKPLLSELAKHTQKIKHLKYRDHHSFSEQDVEYIAKEYKKLGEYSLLLTTEKDYVRLINFEYLKDKTYYWPIHVEIDNEKEFNEIIIDYARKN